LRRCETLTRRRSLPRVRSDNGRSAWAFVKAGLPSDFRPDIGSPRVPGDACVRVETTHPGGARRLLVASGTPLRGPSRAPVAKPSSSLRPSYRTSSTPASKPALLAPCSALGERGAPVGGQAGRRHAAAVYHGEPGSQQRGHIKRVPLRNAS